MRFLEVYAKSFSSVGGVEVHIHDLCNCLRRRGHQVFLLSYAEEGPKSEAIKGVGLLRVKIPDLFLSLRCPGIITLIFLIIYFARKMKIDVVHVHGYDAAMAGAFVKKISHKPVVATFHLAPRYTNRPLILFDCLEKRLRAQLMSCLDVLVGVSRHTLFELRRSGVKSSNIRLVWNWVPLSTVSLEKTLARSEEKNSPLDSNSAVNIIAVGRLSSQKGFDILIRAVHSLVREGLDIHVKIIGDGPERNHLTQMCINLDLEKHVEITGSVSDREKIPLIESSDIFILPSRFEGLPLTVLEAMYLGTPVIATNVGGIKEIITDGCDGVLIEPNVPSLILSLKSVIAHTSFRNKIAERARETVEGRFSPDNCMKTVYLLEHLPKRDSNS